MKVDGAESNIFLYTELSLTEKTIYLS